MNYESCLDQPNLAGLAPSIFYARVRHMTPGWIRTVRHLDASSTLIGNQMPATRQDTGTLNSRSRAAAEGIAASVFYIVFAFAALRLIDASVALPWLRAEDAQVVSGFIVGSVSQLAALTVLWFWLRPVDLAAAVATIRVVPKTEGWFIALTIILVETVVMYGFILDVGWEAVKPSALNVTGSLAPLLDGVTQEVFFRGYLMLRLKRGGHGLVGQVLLSSLAFSSIHLGYVGAEWSEALAPLLGTLGLGAALGWAFIRSGYSIVPPIIAHVVILAIVQPWLALAR